MSYRDEPVREYVEDEEPRLDVQRKIAGVPARLDALDKGLMLLAEQVERAGGALSPALLPERPHPVDGDTRNADRPDESELAARLDAAAARAYRLGRALAELLDRLDL